VGHLNTSYLKYTTLNKFESLDGCSFFPNGFRKWWHAAQYDTPKKQKNTENVKKQERELAMRGAIVRSPKPST
jgi:hypothetical protein